jgi:hypothetical protein
MTYISVLQLVMHDLDFLHHLSTFKPVLLLSVINYLKNRVALTTSRFVIKAEGAVYTNPLSVD